MPYHHQPPAGAGRWISSALHVLCSMALLFAAGVVVADEHVPNRGIYPPTGSACLRGMDGKILCSPIDGGIETDINGKLQCGPGYCTRDLKGEVFCSTTSKGSAAVDMNGKAVCTNGCMPGQSSLCLTPSS